ncbi:hypothetical protein [Desulfoferrobacter suflitae]|uniref:hypothetical protein n=1 Tax=Desulfoferrobacter suflitae TaxID=2865782 RepID=UPI002164A930|nr:hypothetical protein [Desulfoferrobacter suflitae]MCK8600264.1 hypothetical protein [Desulfoferrobacter suflitae]
MELFHHIALLGCLLLSIFLAATSISLADDHKRDKDHLFAYQHKKYLNGFRKAIGGERDDGNETTVSWLWIDMAFYA